MAVLIHMPCLDGIFAFPRRRQPGVEDGAVELRPEAADDGQDVGRPHKGPSHDQAAVVSRNDGIPENQGLVKVGQ